MKREVKKACPKTKNTMNNRSRLFRKNGSSGGGGLRSGAANPFLLVLSFGVFLSGILYVYALNRAAVQGYETRTLEKEIAALKKENTRLKLSEAEALSLSAIEAAVKAREMMPAEGVRVVADRGVLAAR